jgi:Dyp-type peroxidase family
MESLYQRKAPIDQNTLRSLQGDPQKPLESLQGNILHGHGRNRSVHIFLKFNDHEQANVKRWIMKLAKRITSVQRQLNELEQYRQYKIPGRLFMSFFLSANGYTYLSFDPNDKLRFADEAFRCGMKKAQDRLNDPPTKKWDEGYQDDIHAMVLLADNDEHLLLRKARRLLEDVRSHAKICAIEHGKVMRNRQGNAVEHFGFADSRNQPLFFESDIEREKQKGNQMKDWNPGEGPNLVLVPDPYGRKECDSGSYLVFRKLEQRVHDFETHVQELAQKLATPLDPSPEDMNRVGALVMGRFKDGTPVAVQGVAGQPTNDFTYKDDPNGLRCPFQAHIRKVNPRQKDDGFPRIVRRGITYGTREIEPKDKPSLKDLPEKDVGLLFMCYQRNIERQFESLQYVWASDPRLPPRQEPGIDPVIGQPGGMGVGQQRWPTKWDDRHAKRESFDFHGFVTLKGGEYFFAPSIYFLRNIHKY